MPPSPNPMVPVSPAPASHLPGRLTSLEDVMNTMPALEKINDLVCRLKVQALVVVVHQLFYAIPALNVLSFVLDDNGLFQAFMGNDEYQEDLDQASHLVLRLDLSPSMCEMFDTNQPFNRAEVREQLASAYAEALSSEQQSRGGQWEPFWLSLPPIQVFDDDGGGGLDEEDPYPHTPYHE